MKIITLADVPDHLANEWLQYMRSFDAKHPGCTFIVIGTAPEMTVTEMKKVLSVDPAFDIIDVIKRRQN